MVREKIVSGAAVGEAPLLGCYHFCSIIFSRYFLECILFSIFRYSLEFVTFFAGEDSVKGIFNFLGIHFFGIFWTFKLSIFLWYFLEFLLSIYFQHI